MNLVWRVTASKWGLVCLIELTTLGCVFLLFCTNYPSSGICVFCERFSLRWSVVGFIGRKECLFLLSCSKVRLEESGLGMDLGRRGLVYLTVVIIVFVSSNLSVRSVLLR
jgi:hypothetical protein